MAVSTIFSTTAKMESSTIAICVDTIRVLGCRGVAVVFHRALRIAPAAVYFPQGSLFGTLIVLVVEIGRSREARQEVAASIFLSEAHSV